jgi:hypothetical protein
LDGFLAISGDAGGHRYSPPGLHRLQQVIDAYYVLDNLRTELDARDPDTLINAERKVLAFYRYGTILRV